MCASILPTYDQEGPRGDDAGDNHRNRRSRSMALISPWSRCAICEEPLGDRDYLATSGVFFDEGDPLLRFCDAPLH